MTLDEALDICDDARDQKACDFCRTCRSLREVLPELVRRGVHVDAVYRSKQARTIR
jgi:hypothetical protein